MDEILLDDILNNKAKKEKFIVPAEFSKRGEQALESLPERGKYYKWYRVIIQIAAIGLILTSFMLPITYLLKNIDTNIGVSADYNTDDFIKDLENLKYTVYSRTDDNLGVLSALRTVLRTDQGEIEVYQYDSSKAMEKEARTIRPDGYQTGKSQTFTWANPPHFFKKGRIIVFYNGSSTWVPVDIRRILGHEITEH